MGGGGGGGGTMNILIARFIQAFYILSYLYFCPPLYQEVAERHSAVKCANLYKPYGSNNARQPDSLQLIMMIRDCRRGAAATD